MIEKASQTRATARCAGASRAYASKHPCHGFRRAWAALRYDPGRVVNKKKVHRLWCQEGLQRRLRSPRKRAGIPTVPPVEADAAKVVWALDFQYDATTDGKAIKIASMIDQHTRESLSDLVERARSPLIASYPSSSACSLQLAIRRRCFAWTMAQS